MIKSNIIPATKETAKTPVQATTKISTCLPTPIWDKLVAILRSPYSRADEGKLDRGDIAQWILEQALSSIANKGYHDQLSAFIEQKGLKEEFETFFKTNSSLL